MLRTQIYLPKELRFRLGQVANQLNLPMAEVIRIILEKGLEDKRRIVFSGNELWRLADLEIKGSPRDLSRNLEKYLYGKE